MPLDVEGITAELQSFVLELAVVDSVNGGDIRHMVGPGLHAAIYYVRHQAVGGVSGLDVVSLRVEYAIRLYGSTQVEPSDSLDPDMVRAVDKICNAFAEGFTLEGKVRNVDLLAAHGKGLEGQSGYLPTGDGLCRIVDITVPLICNDVWELEG